VPDRTLLWGWLQEGGPAVADGGGAATPPQFVGAMSLPRELSVRDGRLHSRPAREIAEIWSRPPLAHVTKLRIPDGGSVRLATEPPASYRLTFAVQRPAGRAGVRLGTDTFGNLVWLGLVATPGPGLVAGAWRDGHLTEWYRAPLPVSPDPVLVEVYVDAGIVEAFTADAALTLRMNPAESRAAGIALDAAGGTAVFTDVAVVAAPD
jgi:sucrose-6-phosphate hydrolase SacC (GH32 family)